jgi:pyruvate kinase
MRHTKIVATLGPASDSDSVLDELMLAGVDVIRLNFSHSTPEDHAKNCARVRDAAARAGRTVAVLQDLSGPKIRTGPLASSGPLSLQSGGELAIVTGDFPGEPGRVSTTCAELARAVRPGQDLLLDDGRVVLRVLDTDGTTIRTRVEHGTSLGAHKGISAPGVTLSLSALTPKDASDLAFGLAMGVDMVALSFVQSAADLLHAREALRSAGRPRVPLIAKLERPEAIARLDEVLAHSDAVMVARGDLGLEVPLEHVPRLQKEITRKARAAGVPVIVATQVLESMRTEPRPTRAEVSDAANAVDDGVDAIMLAGETAAGSYPAEAVRTLDAIIRDAERLPPLAVEVTGSPMIAGHGRAICDAAITLATQGQAEAIVAVTREGHTARMLSALRPQACILAATADVEVARRLALDRSVHPVVIGLDADLDTINRRVADALLARGLVRAGAVIVFVSVSQDLGGHRANYLKLERIGASGVASA